MLRKIHQDVRYRRALSLAIDRDEINQTLFFGRATPRQMTVLPTSKYFTPEFEQAWSAFDVDQANKLLDEMGLKWNGGKPLQYTFDYYDAEGPKAPVMELVVEYWRKIGLDVKLLVSIGSTLVVYLLAIPIGVYSAVRQYSVGDYVFTILGFIGLAIPQLSFRAGPDAVLL